jgi:hypothetical protein
MQNHQHKDEFHECYDDNGATNYAQVAVFLPPGLKDAKTRSHRSLFNVGPNAGKDEDWERKINKPLASRRCPT